MANIVFTNNASGLLAASINASELTLQVASGFGALFPNPTGGQYFMAALVDASGNLEVVKCTGRATDVLTIVRGQEGSTAQSWTLTATRVELRLTKGTMEEFVQVNGDSMSGNLNMVTNELQNAELTGTTVVTGGQTVGTSIRGTLDDTSNEIDVPSGGGRATAGGAELVVDTDDIVALLDTAGIIILDSATVGVVIEGGAYLRVEGPTAANHMNVAHDDTDCNFTFPNTTEVNWDTTLNLAGSLKLSDNALERPLMVDYAVKHQAKTGTTTTTLNYTLGQSIALTLGAASITTLTLSNPPAAGIYGVYRIRIIQGSTARTINWPASVQWVGGVEPDLTTVSVNYLVYLETDDGGSTYLGTFGEAFS